MAQESAVIAAANAELRKVEAAIATKPQEAPKTVATPNGRTVVTAVHAICRCGRPLAKYADSPSFFGQCLSFFQTGEFATENCSRNVGGEMLNEKGEKVSIVLWNKPSQPLPADKQTLKL